ncbi:hypothetical protein As57867_007060, partial [Aphanomyces stellatus]
MHHCSICTVEHTSHITSIMTLSHIVVVGGGYLGIQFAQELAKQLPSSSQATITVVEKNDFTFHCIGMPRALVDSSYVPKLFLPLTHALPSANTKILRGIADKIDGHSLLVREISAGDQVASAPTRVPFDYLVLATGSSYASPIKVAKDQFFREGVETAIATTAACIQAANSVLVVGGGPVGIEVAAEIAVKHPSKHVTILDANKELVANARVSDAFRTQVTDKLTALGVNLVLGERLPQRLTSHGLTKTTLETDK